MMMGPRQIAGASRSTISPSDMIFTPWLWSGWILLPRSRAGPGSRRAGSGSCRCGAGVGDVDPHGGHTLHSLDGLASFAGEGRWVGWGEHERECDVPRAVHRHVLHHACREDVLAEAGV